jgi:hypothetical protein
MAQPVSLVAREGGLEHSAGHAPGATDSLGPLEVRFTAFRRPRVVSLIGAVLDRAPRGVLVAVGGVLD